MDFELTAAQQAWMEGLRELIARDVEPQVAEVDKEERFPQEIWDKLVSYGLCGLPVPQAYGGAGQPFLMAVMAEEEISQSLPAVALALAVQWGICDILLQFGTEAQIRQYLPPLAQGQKIAAFMLSEPGGGSDPAALLTQAIREGEGYRINGHKRWITSATVAGLFVLFARTEDGKASCFLVERGEPGLKIGRVADKLGYRGSDTCDVHLEGLWVPQERLLGKPGEGLRVGFTMLDGSRIGVGAQGVGIAQAALNEAVRHARERHVFGRPLGANQAIQWMIADMTLKIEAARLLVYQAARLKDRGQGHTQAASMAKLYGSEVAAETTRQAVQIFGGYGCTKEYKVERLYRDAKLTEIFEGTSEIQRIIIARQALGSELVRTH
ncbi:MAG: acyl-CoA dehydrogenase family protein [Candidatus Tectomicrobia bacterium]|uniref:Acyl-CoA dehydrogenase family protein n=1 Tax=Tectimicrobiota bacterium TaxID=2528274 RepID=A0A932CMX3_UNCTE|nr:acyl-CoA dehydrogenase family protein [Candidatus Tectomicrobia bacterium]